MLCTRCCVPDDVYPMLCTRLPVPGLFPVWGVSNWDLGRLKAAIAYADATGKVPPTCDSLQFSLAQVGAVSVL